MPEAQEASSLQEQEFKEWLLHPVTKRMMAAAAERKEAVKEQWASGSLTAETFEGTMQLNAKGIGRCQELDWLLNLEFTSVYEEMESARSPQE